MARRRSRSPITGASVLAASWYAFAVHARDLDPARRGLCRDRISDQQPGPRSRHRRGPLGGHLAADGAGVRHGAARHSGGRSGTDHLGAGPRGAAVSQSHRSLPADQSDRVQCQPVFRHGRACRDGEHRDRRAVAGPAGLDRRAARACDACSLRGGNYDPADRLRSRRRPSSWPDAIRMRPIRSLRRRSRSTATRWACSAA